MTLVLDPSNSDIATTSENIIGVGTHEFEVNMPGGATWTAGLTVKIEVQSPYPGDATQWETLHTFSAAGTQKIDLFEGRNYRAVASASGPWCWKGLLVDRARR